MASLSSIDSKIHQVLDISEYNPTNSRYIIVGDIHGCFDEFSLLLEKVEFNEPQRNRVDKVMVNNTSSNVKSNDVLILCGDLVNKGPKSIEVIKLAMEVGALAVKGNHDESAIAAYYERKRHFDISVKSCASPVNQATESQNTKSVKKKNKNKNKNKNKQIMTTDEGVEDDNTIIASTKVKTESKYLQDKWKWVDDLEPCQVDWLVSLPYSISIPFLNPPILCVHAGIVPNIPLHEQNLFDLTHMRNVIQDDQQHDNDELGQHGGGGNVERKKTTEKCSLKATEKLDEGGQSWVSAYEGPEHVYFGHDAKRRLQHDMFATGLDTGCCYGGQLSAVVLPSRILYQVQALATYA